jgi:hypothetical protein
MAWKPSAQELRLGHQRAERVKQKMARGNRSEVRIELAGYYNHPAIVPEDETAYKELAKVGAVMGLTRFGNEKSKGSDTYTNDRRSRLHRALDAVMDSCGSRSGARDAKPVSIISKAISVLNASHGFDTVGRKGDNVLVRKGYFYSNGSSEDKVADRAISTLAAAGIKAQVVRKGDIWKRFKGGASIAAQSHWWVELRIIEAAQ